MGGLKNEPLQNHQQIRLQDYLGLLIGPRSQVGRHRQSGGAMTYKLYTLDNRLIAEFDSPSEAIKASIIYLNNGIKTFLESEPT